MSKQPTGPAGSHAEQAPCLAAALAYCDRGWSVLSLQPGGKRPLLAWEELQHRRADAAEVSGWFRRWPAANVGIVTGAISGLLVLDVDPQHGGVESLAALAREGAELPETVEARSGGGGRHLYFSLPPGGLGSRAALRPGLDLRAEGGYIVAPPSRHPSGSLYAWRPQHGPTDRPLAAPPRWLARLARDRAPAGPGHPRSHWRALARGGVSAGRRNTSLASFAGHLLWRGVDPEVTLELLRAWNRTRCRPPLPDAEVVRTLASILRTRDRRKKDRG